MPCTVTSQTRKAQLSFADMRRIVGVALKKIRSEDATVRVHVIGDTMMRRLNRDYRGRDRTTDVLAFSMLEGEEIGPSRGALRVAGEEENDWGDIFLSAPQIARQARRFSVTPREEAVRMLVHGVLHLGGYDHVQPPDARKMFGIQEQLVEHLQKIL